MVVVGSVVVSSLEDVSSDKAKTDAINFLEKRCKERNVLFIQDVGPSLLAGELVSEPLSDGELSP